MHFLVDDTSKALQDWTRLRNSFIDVVFTIHIE